MPPVGGVYLVVLQPAARSRPQQVKAGCDGVVDKQDAQKVPQLSGKQSMQEIYIVDGRHPPLRNDGTPLFGIYRSTQRGLLSPNSGVLDLQGRVTDRKLPYDCLTYLAPAPGMEQASSAPCLATITTILCANPHLLTVKSVSGIQATIKIKGGYITTVVCLKILIYIGSPLMGVEP